MQTLYPMVSVIMPVRNEAAFIERSIQAVLAQDYPHEYIEVIVADGMSTDSTRDIVQFIQAQHPDHNLRLIDNRGRTASAGLNAAIAQAHGEIIMRIDGHCEIARDYMTSCVNHLLNDGVECVGGALKTVGETARAGIIAVAMSSPFGVGRSTFRTLNDKTVLTDTVAFPAFKRDVVERMGPFDERIGPTEDLEYNYRLRKMGGKILLAADVHVTYYCRSSLRSLFRQYFRYGFWKVRVMQKHPRQMQSRQFAPPLFVAILLSSLLLMPFSDMGRMVFALVAGSYTIASLGVSIWLMKKFGRPSLLFLPLFYITLHVSYGLGFWIGVIKHMSPLRIGVPNIFSGVQRHR